MALLPWGSEIDRRDFISGTAAVLAGSTASSIPMFFSSSSVAGSGIFQHGVASGDPMPHSAIIWTRVTPTQEARPGSYAGDPVEVGWQVSRDRSFGRAVERGRVTTGRNRDHTVRIDVRGLEPNTSYFYRFRARGYISAVGHFRTLPARAASPGSMLFGFASCANYQHGRFSAYRHMAEHENLQFVLHLGDYIYEGVSRADSLKGRAHYPAHETVSLSDYRKRHGQYKTDPDLQQLHAAHAFLSTWDDHEVSNNSWARGSKGHDRKNEGPYLERRDAAYRAYLEWMPLRLPAPKRAPTRIYRSTHFGRLVDVCLIDARQYRSRPGGADAKQGSAAMLGHSQMSWFTGLLSSSKARWRIIGSQVLFSSKDDFGLDEPKQSWQGYPANRDHFLQHVANNNIDNVVLLAGDTHASWANDVPIDDLSYPASPTIAVEFAVPSISSGNTDDELGLLPRNPQSLAKEATIRSRNRHVKFVEVDSHGYCVARVNQERVRVDWHYVENKKKRSSSKNRAHSWQVESGTSSVSPA